jgi:CHAD domain-containing protein
VRKRCKRVRSVARLLRPHAKALYRQENAAFRDIARRLSPLRDAHVQLATFDELVTRTDNAERFAHLRNRVVESNHHDDKKLVEEQLSATINEVQTAQERFRNASIPNETAFELIRPGLLFTYKEGRRAMSKAYDQPQAAAFHEWRKRVKDLGYQTQILRDVWPALLKRMRGEVDKLGDLLGKEHDLAVLRDTLLKHEDGSHQEDFQAFLSLLERRDGELRAEAETIGRRIYAEKPRDFLRRISIYFETWQAEIPVPGDAENKILVPQLVS